jgi:hypothetical protein
MRSRNKGTELGVSVEIEKTGDIIPIVEKQIADFISQKGWDKRNCSYNLSFTWGDDTSIDIDGFKRYDDGFDLSSDDTEFIVSSLLKMNVGEIKKINIPLEANPDSTGGKKKVIARLMKREDIQLNFSLVYKITNNDSEESEMLEIR